MEKYLYFDMIVVIGTLWDCFLSTDSLFYSITILYVNLIFY